MASVPATDVVAYRPLVRIGRLAKRAVANRFFVGAVALIAFGFAWEYGSSLLVSQRILPRPSEIYESLDYLSRSPGFFSNHVKVTLVEIVLGFAIGSILGFSLGIVATRARILEWIIEPFVVISQVVPKIALAPLLVVWFGFGVTPKVIIAALVSFFPLLVNVILGVRSIDEGKREMMRSIGATKMQQLVKLELPYTLPYVFTGLKSSIVFSVVGAATAELIGASAGLGSLMIGGMATYDTPLIFAALVVITAIGLVLYGAVALCERLLLSWHESVWLRAEGS